MDGSESVRVRAWARRIGFSVKSKILGSRQSRMQQALQPSGSARKSMFASTMAKDSPEKIDDATKHFTVQKLIAFKKCKTMRDEARHTRAQMGCMRRAKIKHLHLIHS